MVRLLSFAFVSATGRIESVEKDTRGRSEPMHDAYEPEGEPRERCKDNRESAENMRRLLARRVFHWNQMRRTSMSYNAVPHTKLGKDILPESDEVPFSVEQEILDAFEAWIIDDVYWYMRETVNSMGIGCYVNIRFSENGRTEILRSNNALNITISPYLCLLAHTPAVYDLKDAGKAWDFYVRLVDRLYAQLEEDGYRLSARDSLERPLSGKGFVLEGMRDMGFARLTIQWADEELAESLERLEYTSQLDALESGVPLDDIFA